MSLPSPPPQAPPNRLSSPSTTHSTSPQPTNPSTSQSPTSLTAMTLPPSLSSNTSTAGATTSTTTAPTATTPTTATGTNLPPQVPPPPLSPTTQAQQTLEARVAFAATLPSVGSTLTHDLQSRASLLHANETALSKQEHDVAAATADLAKQGDEWAKLLDKGNKELKEVGDLQNWAEGIERELLVLEETLRDVEEGDERREQERLERIERGEEEDGDAKGKGKKGWWW